MTRRRASSVAAVVAAVALALSGCGGDAAGTSGETADPVTAPTTAAAPVTPRGGPLTPDELITATTRSPRPFAVALQQHQPLVVAFVLRGFTDDDYVLDAIAKTRASKAGAGVRYLVYDATTQRNFGDLPRLLDVSSTPTVVVIGRDGKLVSAWNGLVDEQMLRQAVEQARDAVVVP